MERPNYLPDDYTPIKVVSSLDEVLAAELGPKMPGVNCVLYPRSISGDFNALAVYLNSQFPDNNNRFCQAITPAKRDLLTRAQGWSTDTCALAARTLLDDMDKVGREDSAWSPIIRLVRADGYREKKDSELVYSFHADSKRDVLSCYGDDTTEWLRNEDAIRTPNTAERRYIAREGAPVNHFGMGDIWTHACDRRDSNDPEPFAHRARKPSGIPRMLLHAVRKRP